jgi:hypothetical protein
MPYYHKTISGSQNGKFDNISINNTSRKLPIDVNGTQFNLEHILPKKTITGDAGSYTSLLLPKVHVKQKDLLLVDESGKLNIVVTKGDVDDLITADSDEGLIIKSGSVLSAGDHLQLKASPAPIAMTDANGRLDSFNLWHSNFAPYILGYSESSKPDFYSHGLVRQGSATHENKFLRKDGQWGLPSSYTGSVAENFLSLNDTPTAYTDAESKYVRVTYEDGGKLEFNSPTTTEITEGDNLYYTDSRVVLKTSDLLSSGDISSMTINGIVNANAFISTSDVRKKTNVSKMSLKECSFMCKSLHPCKYNLIGGSRKRYGFIAQEVQKTHPELVVEKDDASLGIDYIDIIAGLIGKTQDLQNQIDEMKRQN